MISNLGSLLLTTWYRSYSRLLAFECSRILWRLGADVRVYDPSGLPVKDDVQHQHPKVQELRELSKWSDGHVWVSPEQHGNLVSHKTHSKHNREEISLTYKLTHKKDCSIQKPNRLGASKHRICKTDSRTYVGYCPSIWWIAIFQHCQFSANPRSMDAYVCHP
jgi:hypothetical protein